MVDKILKWLLFSVVVALLPLVFAWSSGWLTGTQKSVADTVARGELFILSAAICAAAIGDLIGKSHLNQMVRRLTYVASGSAVIILMFSTFFYATVANAPGASAAAVAFLSGSFYIASVLTGAASIALAEV